MFQRGWNSMLYSMWLIINVVHVMHKPREVALYYTLSYVINIFIWGIIIIKNDKHWSHVARAHKLLSIRIHISEEQTCFSFSILLSLSLKCNQYPTHTNTLWCVYYPFSSPHRNEEPMYGKHKFLLFTSGETGPFICLSSKRRLSLVPICSVYLARQVMM